MSLLHPSKCQQDFLSFQYHELDVQEMMKTHQDDSFKQIDDQLNQCLASFLQRTKLIIQQWKDTNVKKYQEIISTIDISLRSNIYHVIYEQIRIEKQNLHQIVNQVSEKIAKMKKSSLIKNKTRTQSQDKTIHMPKYKENQNLLLKSRSISNDLNPRRKLSKGSFFAQAKKVNLNETKTNDCIIKTNPVPGFYNKNDKNVSKVKKVKRKEQNCFDVLQRCNSITSPSNFMLNYVNTKEILRNNDLNITEKSRIHQQAHQVADKHHIIINQNIASNSSNQDSSCVQSQTYQKLMINFEEKISKKLDDLMIKYTKIQEKLQNSEDDKQKYQLKRLQKLEKTKQNAISIEQPLNSNNNDELVNLPEVSLKSLKKINDKNDQIKNCQDDKTKIKNTNEKEPNKKGIKSIQINNKVVKNKNKIIQNFQDSLEQITIGKEKNKQTTADKNQQIIKQQNLKKQHQMLLQSTKNHALNSDKQYFQTLIQEFYSITQKVLLPITKQLLFVILTKYQTYCQQNNLQLNKDIMNIQTKKLQNINKQYQELLEKIQKVIDSKCDKGKKDKLLMYFSKFIQVITSYDHHKNTITKSDEQFSENDLKARLKQIRLQL